MTKPTRRGRLRRRIDAISPGVWVIIVSCVNLVSTGIFVFAATQTGQEARRHNCAQVEAAFDGYTDALAAVFGREPDDPDVVEFRASYEDTLRECR